MFGNDDQQQSNNSTPFAALAQDGNSNQTGADNGFMPPTHNGSVNSAHASPNAHTPSSGGGHSDELLDLKQQALQQLTPLVGHLEQQPEEKFRTLMMMIQASDDQTKLKEAFETAKKITDDKARAQALLDVINEINYFTQQHNN